MRRITKNNFPNIKEKMLDNAFRNEKKNIVINDSFIEELINEEFDIADMEVELKKLFKKILNKDYKYDEELVINDVCILLTELSKRLTTRETIYFVDVFFNHKNNIEIMDEINISKYLFNKLKKSCIFKTYILFEQLCNVI